MANNITLITTAGGTVTAKEDGALNAAMYPDGILNGCTFSAASETLYLTAGKMIVGGRVLTNASQSSWSLPSSVCYLKAAISSEALTVSVVTSNTTDDDDINLDGTDYSVILCTVDNSGDTPSITSSFPNIAKQGILYGTTDTPSSTNYADGTLYVKYTA